MGSQEYKNNGVQNVKSIEEYDIPEPERLVKWQHVAK